MEEFRPCKKCGAMPVVADAEQFFADENGGMMLSIYRTFYVCPRCGKDTAPSYIEICQAGQRRADRIKLWNNHQQASPEHN